MVPASILNRAVSRGIDLVIALSLAEALPRAGWVAGLLYILIADGVSGGQSLGKKILGLRVITSEGEACGLRESILRNLIFGVGVLLWMVPILGWALLGAAIAVEFLVLMGSKKGKRLGDEFADTAVVYEAGHEDAATCAKDDDSAADSGDDDDSDDEDKEENSSE